LTTGIELLKTLPETPEHTQHALTLLVNPLRNSFAANLFSIKHYKKYLCSLK
jgi:hypothetical protein